MNLSMVGIISGRSSKKIANFVPICLQTWPLQAILVSNWLILKKIFSSETARPKEPKLDGKHHWKVIRKVVPFRFEQ